jgi:hypothetical protein
VELKQVVHIVTTGLQRVSTRVLVKEISLEVKVQHILYLGYDEAGRHFNILRATTVTVKKPNAIASRINRSGCSLSASLFY